MNMLSILIPVYNYNCSLLIKNLYEQAIETDIPFEIICMDDASTMFKEENRNINSMSNCHYIESVKNVGRSKIRNLLANEAQYEYLLFMDCDSEPVTSDYIKNYIKEARKNTIVCGGTKYKDENILPKYRLRYLYGKAKEEIPAGTRSLNPYDKFTTFNFMAPKSVFNILNFNEKITRYGHEDTFFGLELRSRGFEIKHIDNPLYHLGLDENSEYIQKCKQSLENILFLSKQIPKEYVNGFSILKYYLVAKKTGLSVPLRWIYRFFRTGMEKQLTGKNPNLNILALYKLSCICFLGKKSGY